MQAADGAEARGRHGDRLLCPAAVCEPGAILVGMVGADARVGYVLPQVPVSERFIAFARTSGAPERRFRFASPCVEDACRHWCAGRCLVIDQVAATVDPRDAAGPVAVPLPLPRCSIRAECRWFDQLGLDACAVCPFVVTERRTRA
ncbi:MAG TPA: hypothetical protein VIB48_19515 [Acidimicrobiia bacterium]|jgi:hypothetical protein